MTMIKANCGIMYFNFAQCRLKQIQNIVIVKTKKRIKKAEPRYVKQEFLTLIRSQKKLLAFIFAFNDFINKIKQNKKLLTLKLITILLYAIAS